MLLVQTLSLHADARARVHRCEFALAMHLIVCRTKRGLAKLPLEFPTELFPQLQVASWRPQPTHSTTFSAFNAVSSRPAMDTYAFLQDHTFTPTTPSPSAYKLSTTSSPQDLLQKQVRQLQSLIV